MKRRLVGLIGLVVLLVVVDLIWQHLSGGDGLTRNLLRNVLIAMLIPFAIYFLVQLFGKNKDLGKDNLQKPN